MYDYLAKIILLGPSGSGKYDTTFPGDRLSKVNIARTGPVYCIVL